MYNNCAETHLSGEFWALLSSRYRHCSCIDRSCDITYVAMHTLSHNNDATKRYSMLEQARGLNIIELLIYLVKRPFWVHSVIYCISCELLCINWNAISCHIIRGLSMSWWMQTEFSKLSKGQSRNCTRSVVPLDVHYILFQFLYSGAAIRQFMSSSYNV